MCYIAIVILPIVQAGDPVLRAPARPLSLEEIQSTAIQQLIADMRETMRAAPGVGLAAPQVGLGLQLAVIEDAPEYQANATSEELTERERAVVPFHVIINPALTLEPGAPVEFFEGCLSVDGWMAMVARAAAVRVEALDENGRDVASSARLARAHPAARDRSPARHVVRRPHGSAHALEPSELLEVLARALGDGRPRRPARARSIAYTFAVHPVCRGCEAPCCVGRVVPVGDDEVAQLASVLGVTSSAFSDGGALRRRDDGACVFAIAVGDSYRCAIKHDKPRACRVYPYHVAVAAEGAWTAALGNDAACRRRATTHGPRGSTTSAPPSAPPCAPPPSHDARKLPVVSDSACFGCTTSCCLEYDVPVDAHDVWRLARALGVSWRALVRVRPTPSSWVDSFTLDDSGRKLALHLHRRANGACALLTTLPDGSHAAACTPSAHSPVACIPIAATGRRARPCACKPRRSVRRNTAA